MPCQTLASRRLRNNGPFHTVPAHITVIVRQGSTRSGTVLASSTWKTGGDVVGAKPVVVCSLSTGDGIGAGLWTVVSLGTDIAICFVDRVHQNCSSSTVVACLNKSQEDMVIKSRSDEKQSMHFEHSVFYKYKSIFTW